MSRALDVLDGEQTACVREDMVDEGVCHKLVTGTQEPVEENIKCEVCHQPLENSQHMLAHTHTHPHIEGSSGDINTHPTPEPNPH